jgi:hypothetical protein
MMDRYGEFQRGVKGEINPPRSPFDKGDEISDKGVEEGRRGRRKSPSCPSFSRREADLPKGSEGGQRGIGYK